MAITREFLSESTNGGYINVTASGSPGTLIHTATSTVGEKDEVWIWGVNNTANTADVIIEWGGVDDVLNVTQVGMPSATGRQLLVAGESLAGGLEVKVFSDQLSAMSSGINVGGNVNRMSNG
jgi:hypothetical protein